MVRSNAPVDDELLRSLLRASELPRDALPYTDEFARMKASYATQASQRLSDREFWRAISRVAKQGGLGTGRKKKSPSGPVLSHDQQLELMRLFPDGIGSRDQLPYTNEFDELRERFCRLTVTQMSKRDFWRCVSNIAKRSRKPAPLAGPIQLLGLPDELVRMLEIQNPWWRGRPAPATQKVRRWAYREVVRRVDSGIAPIIALRGTRQVGKTEIQRQFIEELLLLRQVPPTHILRVQFDEVPTLGQFTMPIQAIVHWYEQGILREPINAAAKRGEPVYLFLDELQNLRGWENQLKSLVDHMDVKVVATGSSALRIAQGQDSLAGRISMIHLGPLRLREISAIRFDQMLPAFSSSENGLDQWCSREFWRDAGSYAQRHEKALKQAFKAFSDFGGYPLCHKRGDDDPEDRLQLRDEALALVVERTIRHDLRAGTRGRYRDDQSLSTVFRHACRYTGQTLTPTLISQELERRGFGSVSRDAVEDALRFLVDSLLLSEVPAFEALGRRAAQPSKYCLCDHFIREAWLQEQIPLVPSELAQVDQAVATQAGHLAESIIGAWFSNIPGLDVSWLSGLKSDSGKRPEVDFILTIGLKRIPVEVKYQRNVNASDLAGIRAFCAHPGYEASFGIVVTQDRFSEDEDAFMLPLYALLAIR